MSRRGSYFVGSLVALFVGILVWYGQSGTAAARVATPSVDDVPHLWHWQISHVPPPPHQDQGCVALVLRTRAEPLVPGVTPMEYHEPLGPRAGTERVLGTEGLCSDGAQGVRISIQILDLRKIGLMPEQIDDPLRIMTTGRVGEAGWTTHRKLHGHSLRGHPVLHDDNWDDGELALMSLQTIGADQVFTSTFVLTLRAEYR